MGRFVDLTGKRFGRLTVTERVNNTKRTSWKCMCDCGGVKIVVGDNLTSGKVRSCGCLRKEVSAVLVRSISKTTHGQSKTRLYKIWAAMKDRCYNEHNAEYRNYGARGITVCQEWLSDFEPFYRWSIGNGYKAGLSIDRIKGFEGYSPENCRWATPKVQGNNTRRNHLLEYKGEVHTIAEWAEIKGIKYNTLNGRIYKGWSVDRALES